MLRAIAAAKKKNDRINAHKIANCLRCYFLPESYMASTEIRERRRTLRYRNLLVRQAVQMKNKVKWMSGSKMARNHRRETRTRAEDPEEFCYALLLSASGELLPS